MNTDVASPPPALSSSTAAGGTPSPLEASAGPPFTLSLPSYSESSPSGNENLLIISEICHLEACSSLYSLPHPEAASPESPAGPRCFWPDLHIIGFLQISLAPAFPEDAAGDIFPVVSIALYGFQEEKGKIQI